MPWPIEQNEVVKEADGEDDGFLVGNMTQPISSFKEFAPSRLDNASQQEVLNSL